MRKALQHSDTGIQEMADYLGVSRNSASNWINDRITPKTQTMRLWALRTGVPLEWLLTGETPMEWGGGDSNPEPDVSGVEGDYIRLVAA
jgi:transcriptional regulator with XRE-family HTH domain